MISDNDGCSRADHAEIKSNFEAKPKKNEYSLIAVVGGYFVALPINISYYDMTNTKTEFYLIDDTRICGSYDNGVFVVRVFDRNSEIMQNVIRSITSKRCYDTELCNIPDDATDNNMNIARILKTYDYYRRE